MSPHQDRDAAASHKTSSRRVAYTLAAGAAAGGLAADSDGAVVYSGPQDLPVAQFGALDLNLDGDAYTDVLLKNYVLGAGNYQGATVNGYPGKLVGFNNGLAYVSALSAGSLIDGSTLGTGFFGSLAYGAANPNAEFNSVSGAYIGLSFPIGGNAPQFAHYGWVRVSIDNAAGTFVINDWAYDDVPGQGILAGQVPEPGSLGLLAAGALGVAALKRRRSAAQA
ncbi:PEP-CTERM motif protein [Pirellulimonas nuda]|uniref:PEP-CTERM motif protein n=1 Tax=Pirellulimonas nuda TaxID=2528009 RepID=A0A518DD54_9BACT|nr:PEP-CTERM sorting domain-containing protein [Pirellulimonas nuda]QDU89415.1 PEP-CTERM motif protein [Pirellulimonas nuda]